MKTKSKLITVLLILCALNGISQSEGLKQNMINIGLVYSPEICFSKPAISIGYTGFNIQQKSFNYSTGLIGYFTSIRKYEIGTGLIYSNKDFIGTWYCQVCDYIIAPEPELIKLRYIEIPVFFRYHLFNKKPDLFIETGLINDFLTTEPSSRYGGGTLAGNKFIFSGQVGLGINIYVLKQIDLFGTMMYRHSLTGSFINSDFRIQSIGLITGIIYKF